MIDLLVNIAANQACIVQAGQTIQCTPAIVGCSNTPTPTGTFNVSTIFVNNNAPLISPTGFG